jgi:hypothetical protein
MTTITARNAGGAIVEIEYYAYHRKSESPTRYARVALPDGKFVLKYNAAPGGCMEMALCSVDVITGGEVTRPQYTHRDMQREYLISAIPMETKTTVMGLTCMDINSAFSWPVNEGPHDSRRWPPPPPYWQPRLRL